MGWVKRVLGLGAGFTVVLALHGSAFALSTAVHEFSSSGPLYAGRVQFTLLNSATLTFMGTSQFTCTQSALEGPIQSDGTSTGVTAATLTGATLNGSCIGPSSTVVVTAQSLPWAFNVEWGPVGNGRDFTLTIPDVRLQVAFSAGIPSPCLYRGALFAEGYNRTNPARPFPPAADAQVRFNQNGFIRTGSSLFCPSSMSFSAMYTMKGESAPLSGVYNRTLWIST